MPTKTHHSSGKVPRDKGKQEPSPKPWTSSGHATTSTPDFEEGRRLINQVEERESLGQAIPRSVRNAPPELRAEIRRNQNNESRRRGTERMRREQEMMERKYAENEARLDELTKQVDELSSELMGTSVAPSAKTGSSSQSKGKSPSKSERGGPSKAKGKGPPKSKGDGSSSSRDSFYGDPF